MISKTLSTIVFTFALFAASAFGQTVSDENVSGFVFYGSPAQAILEADVQLLDPQNIVIRTVRTTTLGIFEFANVREGAYVVRVSKAGFTIRSAAIRVVRAYKANDGRQYDLNFSMEVGLPDENVTVSADFGVAAERRNTPQPVTVIGAESIAQRATSVLAQAGEEEAGLNLQRTSPTLGAIVVRGLTGKNVVNFVDGVRYSNGAQRGGINTFFNLNEPSVLQSIEILRGPNSAQYGSDSLAGTVNLISRSPQFGGDKTEFHGEFMPGFSSADRSYGGSGLFSVGTKKFAGFVSLAGRRFGDTRTADGLDSHSAVTRFLGLPSTVLYDRNPGTGFKQYSGATKLTYAPTDDQHLVFFYERSQQDDGKRFDQMLGGDANLIADLRNLMLDFGYLRYVKQGLGFFDNGSFTVSYNSQREERVNQGGQGNPFGDITHQYERTSTVGVSGFVDKQIGSNNTIVFGGDFYHEKLNSPAYLHNPVTNVVTLSRPRVPDEARFDSGGVYVQDQWNVIPDRLRITGAIRYSSMTYRVRAADSPLVNGQPLWSDDELKTSGFSGRVGAVIRAHKDLRFAVNYGRGFRYPSMTDLGTLGLTGDGFEVDHITAGLLGGRIGTTAGDNAVTTGLPVAKQESEFSNNVDFAIRYERKGFDTEFTIFRLELVNAITKQALILPQGAEGQTLAGQTITGQTTGGAVFVAAATNPVLVRANFSSANIWGIEYETEAKLRSDLTFRANFTYIRAADSETGLPPNIEGGTPPPNAFLSLRYDRPRFWVEAYSTLAVKQDRLSILDLGDRRTGAARSRAQIANFFRRGACVRGLTTNISGTGCGTTQGNPTYILISTGETLSQVQDRVLPGITDNNVSVPLYTYLPGYGIANLRGGVNITDKAAVYWAFENIFDQFYRNPSWGIDGAGRSFSVRMRYSF
jgi:hemoglobin/transferrin/lactoferrin receptor protein